MSERGRYIAVYFAGIATSETFGHWALGLWGTHLFPLKILGLTFTERFNWFAMAAWPLVLLTCLYFAWGRRSGAEAPDTSRVVG